MAEEHGKMDRRSLLKMIGAAGASATAMSACGLDQSLGATGLSGAEFDKSMPLATAGPGGNKNWQPGDTLKFLPPEEIPTRGAAAGRVGGPLQGGAARVLSADAGEPQVGKRNIRTCSWPATTGCMARSTRMWARRRLPWA